MSTLEPYLPPGALLLASGMASFRYALPAFGTDNQPEGLFAIGAEIEQLDDCRGTGVSVHGNRVYRLVRTPTKLASLVVYSADGIELYRGLDIRDPHSVVRHGDDIVAVGTWNNEIVLLDETGSLRSRWSAPGQGDSCHLNCVLSHRGRLYVSAFGRFTAHKDWTRDWGRATGVVVDLRTGRDTLHGLRKPHQVAPTAEGWLVCNSGTGELLRFDRATKAITGTARLSGFPRGLTVTADHVLVGESQPRKHVPAETRADEPAVATVAVLERASLRTVAKVELPCDEIYDLALAPLELVDGIRRGASALPEIHRGSGAFAPTAKSTPHTPGNCRVLVVADVPASMAPRAVCDLQCRFTNRGSTLLRTLPPNPVTIAYRWYCDDGRWLCEESAARTALPGELAPGEEAETLVRLVAPGHDGPHKLSLTLVQEGVRWFDDVDLSNALRVTVRVGRPAGESREVVAKDTAHHGRWAPMPSA